METIVIKGNARTIGNKQAIKALRRNGEVPCVMYGHNLNNLTFSINEKGERTGINPKTKEAITIAAKKVVKFKAGAELADKVK